MSEKSPSQNDETTKPTSSEEKEAMSRSTFLKLAGTALGATLIAGSIARQSANEKEMTPELERLVDGLTSVFDLFPTTGVPDRLKVEGNAVAKIYEGDIILRLVLEERLAQLQENPKERDLIIQSLGYPHIVHNNAFLLGQGFDVYNNFNLLESDHTSDALVLDVMKHDLEEIETGKDNLLHAGIKALRGFVLNYDAHATDYQASKHVDRTFPSIQSLREMHVTRLIYVGEFSPQVEDGIRMQISDESYSPNNHVIDFVQKCQKNGIEVVVWGIDTRDDIERQETPIQAIFLENGDQVIYGGIEPYSNPRVKLSDGTLLRVVGGDVQIIPEDNPLGRPATPEESATYYRLVAEANAQR